MLKNGEYIAEGQDGKLWPNIDQNEVQAVQILGIQLPLGGKYSFSREGMASPGNQPTVTSVTMKAEYGDTVLEYKFIVGSQGAVK